MSLWSVILEAWLLGSETYPALTFVATAAVKSSAIVLLAFALGLLLRRQAALMRLWLWRGTMLVLASLLLWAVAPQALERWRMTLRVEPGPSLGAMVQQAQDLEWLARKELRLPAEQAPPAELLQPRAPLAAYERPLPDAGAGHAAEPQRLLSFLRLPWLAQVERTVLRVWWAGAALLLAWRVTRAACGHVWLRRQHSADLPAPQGKDCRLHLVPELLSPVVTGLRGARIWLPAEAAEWPAAKLRAVCLHEMAHHQRRDSLWLWLGCVVAAVWWWNPLVRMGLRAMTDEAEMAADQAALEADVAAPDYAQVLVEIASASPAAAPAAGIPMLGSSGIERRVRAILERTGRSGLLGRKARLSLAALAVAGVVAAGVEARHPLQEETKATALSAEQIKQVDRSLALLQTQAARLNIIHLKMSQDWEESGKETVRSPQPSRIEAWVDHAGRKFRCEKKPEVSRWTNGAAPWSIEDSIKACDGERTWYQRGAKEQPHFYQDPMRMMFAPWEGNHAEQLLRTLRKLRESGMLESSGQEHTVQALDDNRLEVRTRQGNRDLVWTLDLTAGGIVAYREHYDKLPQATSLHWQALSWAELPDGTRYPSRWQWTTQSKSGQTVYDNTITSLETLPALPAALLALPLPEDVESPYVARDGLTTHEPELEVRFIHAETGAAVPNVRVDYDLNQASRVEIKSDAAGVAHIPLPEGEVKYLRLWGIKAGYVMQTVLWRRAGDPLKLPASYTTKLTPDGGPIGGLVVDAAGQPVAGAKVQVLHRGGRDSWEVFADMHDHGKSRTVTDAEGRWKLHTFAADLSGLILWVEHPRYKRVATGYQTATGQPFSSLRDGTSRVVLQTAGIELTGVVADAGGKPVPKCKVTLGSDRWGSKEVPEAVTDAAGRFTVFVHEAGKVELTFEAASLQPLRLQTQVAKEEPPKPLAVVLQQGAGLRLRVVDEQGRPVAKAQMIPDRWQDKRTLWYEGTTDDTGLLVWEGAPADEALWTVLGANRILRDVPITPTGKEQTLVLRPATRFTGTVVNATTGEPVPQFKVTLGDTRRATGKYPNADIYWQTPEARTFRAGSFTLEAWEMRFDHTLLIEEEGYEPLQTATFPSRQQDETLELKLTPKR